MAATGGAGGVGGGGGGGADPTGGMLNFGTQVLGSTLNDVNNQKNAAVDAGRQQTQALIDNTTTNSGTEGYSPQALATAGGDARAKTGAAG